MISRVNMANEVRWWHRGLQPFLNRHACKSPDGGLYHHRYADPEESRSAVHRVWWPVQLKDLNYLALGYHVV